MENSMNSMSRSPSAVFLYDENHHHESPEESSWTMYFEDFSNDNSVDVVDDENSFSSDINYQSSSLISDAACSAAKRHAFGASNLDDKSCNRLSFKKKRKANKKRGLVDDDLEDTASSPVNSPKVCSLMNHFDNKNLKQKEVMDNISQEKGSASGDDQIRNGELNYIGRGENDGTTDQLKKRGLCLVPLSMVVHYLG